MRIIETRAAPNPRRVRIFLAEKQIAVPFEEVEITQGELRTHEFSSVNPWQRVPVLILDDGTAISESVAICRYFEELQSEPALFGRGAVGRALVAIDFMKAARLRRPDGLTHLERWHREVSSRPSVAA